MTKIMLVEDDNNLREIYEARLAAEGYTIVSAQDGEAALALAAKERPDLVITDVMMPKISGFEMLDILRNTETLRDVKVIMLTALGQSEDNARANSLGADRYLVKSQVTLEDIVKATHEVLEPAAPAAPAPEAGSWQAGVTDESAVASTAQPAPVEQPTAVAVETPAIVTTPAVESEAEPQTDVAAVPAVDIVPAAPAVPDQFVQPPADPDQPPQVQPLDPEVTTEDVQAPAAVFVPDAAASMPDVPAPVQYIETPVAPIVTADAEPADSEPVAAQLDLPDVPVVETPPTTIAVTSTDDSVSSTATDAAAQDTTTVSSDDFVAMTPPPVFDQPAAPEAELPQPEVVAAQPEITTAAPAAEEESVMRDKIDQFLGDLTPATEAPLVESTPEQNSGQTTDQAPEQASSMPAEPLAQPTTEPAPPLAVTDTNNNFPEMHQPPADEAESEYTKNDTAPDMGQLDIHAAEALPVPTPPVPQPMQSDEPAVPAVPIASVPDTTDTAQLADNPNSAPTDTAPTPSAYPSQAYELPVMPGAAIDDTRDQPPVVPVTPQQAASDKLVADAVDDMVAASEPVSLPAPSEVAAQQYEQPSGAAAAPLAPQPPQPDATLSGPTAPSPTGDTTGQVPNIVARKKVIEPLSTVTRPDINQLLALEEAKAAAQAAAAQPLAAAPPISAPAATAQPETPDQAGGWRPLPVTEQPRQGKYDAGVDPNSISL